MAKEKDKNLVPENAFDQVIFGWLAPEYLRYERGWLWFAMLFLSCGGLATYGYMTNSLTMLALFSILPLVLILEHRRKPKVVEVLFSAYGIKFGVMKLPYSSIRSFAVLHTPHADEIHLHTHRKMHPEVIIPLMGNNPSAVRHFLVTQVPELEGKELSLLDTLIRILRLN